MAVGETARLIASLELQDKFTRTAVSADRALGRLEGRLGTATRATRGLGVAGVAVGTALGNIGVRLAEAGIRTVFDQFRQGVDALHELENVTVATNTVIASTKGVAGQTASGIRDLAEEYEDLNATMDDKVIQSGENMLLTFTNIRGKAFEPALEAILNINEAMGGGPEGLQGTVIQVGKALNDPVRGLTALRRIGVSFTKQQEQQIKALVKSNDLYGAQQIILKELETEFGGRFAAAGRTAEGQTARLNDKVEDLQKTLAGPLVPALDRAREKVIALLDSPAVLRGAEKLGQAVAGLFSEQNLSRGVALIERGIDALVDADFSGVGGTLSQVAESLIHLPWQAIGDAARLLGTGARALLTAFTSLPPWVQTAVLTGWGLNKLTGGILGQIATSLIKGVLGINAGVVNINAATVHGPLGPNVPTGGGPKIPFTPIPVTTGLGVAALPFVLTGSVPGLDVQTEMLKQQLAQGKDIQQAINDSGVTLGAINALLADPTLQEGLTPEMLEALDAIDGKMGDLVTNTTPEGPKIPGVVPKVPVKLPDTALPKEFGITTLPNTAMSALEGTERNTEKLPPIMDKTRAATVEAASRQRGELIANRATQERTGARIAGIAQGTTNAVNLNRATTAARLASLEGTVRAKKSSVVVKVTTIANVSVSNIQRKLTSSLISSGKVEAIGF